VRFVRPNCRSYVLALSALQGGQFIYSEDIMKKILLLVLLAALAGFAFADEEIDDIYNLYQSGNVEAAERKFDKLPPMTTRDGNRLFVAALFEKEGREAEEMLRGALKADLDGKYEEPARMMLMRIAEARGDDQIAVQQAREYLYRNEKSDSRDQLLAIITAHSAGNESEFRRHANLLADNFPGTAEGQFARLAMAESALSGRNYSTCERLCKTILNDASDYLAPQALILLSRIAVARGKTERALLNYSILRERYPYAIGRDELTALLQDFSDEQTRREAEEVHVGIVYFVQVGVFGDEENARNMAKRVEAYGYRSFIRKKTISSRSYDVVLAGTFRTMQEAEVAKTRLEHGEDDIFKVVVEDER
jgi:hypothetical protein